MRATTLILLLAAAVVVSAYDPEHTGEKWQHQSAGAKQATLNKQCLANPKPYGWYSVRLAELFGEDMNTSFDFVGDDMPDQGLFNAEERPKVIHSVGAVAECKFVSNGQHSFTGLYKGASNGFIRFSAAAEPEPKTPNLIPGVSFKFLRDNVPSANIFAMYALTGHDSFNFFKHDLSNHPPFPADSMLDLGKKMLLKKFKTASKWPTLLGLSSVATHDEAGNEEPSPVFPYRIIFHPTAEMHNKFPDEPSKDKEFYIKQFESIGIVGKIYDVYAEAAPNAPAQLIGEIIQTSEFSGTKYGDKTMFFQHTRMETDLTYRPEWEKPIEEILAHEAATPYYTHPDQPW